MREKNPVITETLRLGVGLLICLGLMLGVYALIGYFGLPVLFGGVVGTVLALGNFFFMAIGLVNLTSQAGETKARARVQGSFILRMAMLLGLLVVAIKLLGCDLVATVIPLVATRPILMVEQFLVNSRMPAAAPEGKEKEHES